MVSIFHSNNIKNYLFETLLRKYYLLILQWNTYLKMKKKIIDYYYFKKDLFIKFWIIGRNKNILSISKIYFS